jgi:hypothetical protein
MVRPRHIGPISDTYEKSDSITDSIPDSFALIGSDKTTYFLSD